MPHHGDAAPDGPGRPAAALSFGATQRSTFPARIDLSVGQFLQMLASRSYLLTAPAAEREEILARSRRQVAPHAVQEHLRVPLAVTVLRSHRR
jgi:hypothetical protein